MNIIFSYLEDPTLVDEHAPLLLSKHPNFKTMMNYSDAFTKAFMKSLQKTLSADYNDELEQIWLKTVQSFILYFKSIL